MTVRPENIDSAPASLPARLFDWLDWRINPVLLRDLRLYARGRLALVGYFLTLTALVLMAVLYALIARFEERDGRTLLSVLTVILAVICGSLVPNLMFERFRSELGNRATELALMSPLTPARLVRGKLLGAWCVSLLVVSAALPMIATSYLLGGVNLLSILGCLGGVLLAAAAMPAPQLLMATQRQMRGLSRGVAGLFFAGQFIAMILYGTFLADTILARSFSRSGAEYAFLAALAVAGILIGQFLYFAAVGRLRSEAESRDAAPRLSLALAAYAGGVAACLLMWHLRNWSGLGSGPELEEMPPIAGVFVAYAFCLGFLVISYSIPTPPRNLRESWRGKPIRAFFLLPGLNPLAAYFVLNTLAILGCSFGPMLLRPHDFGTDIWRAVCLALAPFMAVAFGMVCHRYLVLPLGGNRRSPNLLPLTIILSNIGLGIVAVFAMVLVSYAAGKENLYALILAFNPLGLLVGAFESRELPGEVAVYGACCLGALLVLLLPFALGRRGGAGGAEDGHAPR